jgi:hypothetical protein
MSAGRNSMNLSWSKTVTGFVSSLIASVYISAVSAETAVGNLTEGRKQLGENALQAAKSQQQVDQLDDGYQELLQDYRATNGEIDQLKLYNKQMTAIVENQQVEIKKIDQQIRDIEFTEQGILPLMSQMLDSLESFNQLDLPFLQKERATRLAKLRQLMTRADITISEKYRRVLEAFQIEVEYGRTLETYREKAEDNIVYDYLRIGRTALYRLTLSADQAWAWDKNSKGWLLLDSALLRDIRKAQDVARQSAAPELLTLPLSSAKGGL